VREGFQVGPAEAERDLPVFCKDAVRDGVPHSQRSRARPTSRYSARALSRRPDDSGNDSGRSRRDIRHWKAKLDAGWLRRPTSASGTREGGHPAASRSVVVSDRRRAAAADRALSSDCVARGVGMRPIIAGGLAASGRNTSLEILWSHLAMGQPKNVYYRRTNGFEKRCRMDATIPTSGGKGWPTWGAIAPHISLTAS